jgi:hypothetical protein
VLSHLDVAKALIGISVVAVSHDPESGTFVELGDRHSAGTSSTPSAVHRPTASARSLAIYCRWTLRWPPEENSTDVLPSFTGGFHLLDQLLEASIEVAKFETPLFGLTLRFDNQLSLVVDDKPLVGVRRRSGDGSWSKVDDREDRGERPMYTIVLDDASWSVFDAGEIQQLELA